MVGPMVPASGGGSTSVLPVSGITLAKLTVSVVAVGGVTYRVGVAIGAVPRFPDVWIPLAALLVLGLGFALWEWMTDEFEESMPSDST